MESGLMDTLIPVINKLQEIFSTTGGNLQELKIPQIIAVGAQSSGKSSVLESLVGRPFLPRGTGMVTRYPIVIQMISTHNHGSENIEIGPREWCTFLHQPDQVYTDFDEVSKEIMDYAAKNAGNNRGITKQEVVLKVYSPTVVNLTVVDLPGLVQTPADDQPRDIHKQIYELVREYMENPNSIILAVSAANNDIVNSEGLKLAKEVDTEGKRTLAVVTKLDMMDLGTNAMDVLCGKMINVKLGIIGVKNRSYGDTTASKSIEDSINDEKAYLKKYYSSIADVNGIPYLAKKLNKLLVEHIHGCLPELKAKVTESLGDCRKEKEYCGPKVKDKMLKLLQIIKEFVDLYNFAINGNGESIETTETLAGAQIALALHEGFEKEIFTIDPTLGLTDDHILTAIRNASGARPTLFVPETTFEQIVKGQIPLLENPALKCAQSVHDEMDHIISDCLKQMGKEIEKFPKVGPRLTKATQALLQQRLPKTEKKLRDIIQDQLAYINKKHPDFAQVRDEILRKVRLEREVEENPSNHDEVSKYAYLIAQGDGDVKESLGLRTVYTEKQDCEIIRRLVESYFDIVRKEVQDLVPKSIMHSLVNYVQNNLQSELISKFYKSKGTDDLLDESERISIRRSKAMELEQRLMQAANFINDIGVHTI